MGDTGQVDHRRLGRTGFALSPIGFGAFKIGRNQGIKYAQSYELPDMRDVERLLNGVLDLGINYIDTAPAYGLSEERIGAAISHRKSDFILSTKVGETFVGGQSIFDFSGRAVRESIARSRKRLRIDALDLVIVHSDGDDLRIINETDVVPVLQDLKDQGVVKAIGFSGKTVEGARAAIAGGWADAIMVEYHLNDRSHEQVLLEAAGRGIGVVVKKPLASGALKPRHAIPFILQNRSVASLVIGGLNLAHVRENIEIGSLCG
jgi:aryl-alcohol dehydrogenase-like predicted oxidoreductase